MGQNINAISTFAYREIISTRLLQAGFLHHHFKLVYYLLPKQGSFYIVGFPLRLVIYDDPQFWQTQGDRLGLGGFPENVVGNDHVRDSLVLQVNTVSHGAGSARASSGNTHQGQVHIRQVLDGGRPSRREGVGLDDGDCVRWLEASFYLLFQVFPEREYRHVAVE